MLVKTMKRIKTSVAPERRPLIIPKALEWPLDDRMPTIWFENNTFLTHLMNAFSGVLPQGERFMIDIVRQVRASVGENQALQHDIAGFIGQEAHHAATHLALNNLMAARGIPLAKQGVFVARLINILRRLPIKERMAVTSAIEHGTTLFGKLVLSHPELIEQVHPAMRPFFIWHALEELEHKAVAFDVFQAIGGSYGRRIEGMLLALMIVSGTVLYGQLLFMWNDRSLFNVKDIGTGLWWMFGVGKRAGYFRKILPEFFDFFRPNFHPWQDDSSALITHWRPLLQKLIQSPV